MNAAVAVVFIVLAADTALASSFDDDAKALVGSDQSERAMAQKRLHEGGADAIGALVRGLDDPRREARIRYIETIKEIERSKKKVTPKDSDISELARRARLEPNPGMRRYLLSPLRQSRGATALKELERFATEDPDESIRSEATHYSGELSSGETAFFKKIAATDPSPYVRLAAYLELTATGDASGRAEALRVIASSKKDYERHDAIWILGEIGNPEDVAILTPIAASSTENYEVRNVAHQALKSIELKQYPAIARLSFLIKSLDDPDALVRDWAYLKLWKCPDPLTNVRLRAYLIEPGHKGYKEAADALSLR